MGTSVLAGNSCAFARLKAPMEGAYLIYADLMEKLIIIIIIIVYIYIAHNNKKDSLCGLRPGLTARTLLERSWSGEKNSSPLVTVHHRLTEVGPR